MENNDFGLDKTANLIEVEAELDQIYRSPGGLDKVGQMMLQPLLRDLLHEGRVRQVYATYQLGLGEEALFDADVSVPAAALSMEGLPDQVEVKSDRVRIETTPIAVKALVRWNESNFRKFDILNRTQERAKASIQTQEDKKGFDLLDFSSTLFHSEVTQIAGQTRLNIDSIAEGVARLAEARVMPSKLIINPFRRKDLLLLSAQNAGSPLFAPEKSDALLRQGRVGDIFGLQVLEVPNGEGTVRRTGPNAESISDVTIIDRQKAYVVGPQNYVGVLAVRTDLTVETQKSVNDFADLFGIWEDLGFLIRYSKGILRIGIPTS
jgi:hypothetical protein